jgi:hypothetical protein
MIALEGASLQPIRVVDPGVKTLKGEMYDSQKDRYCRFDFHVSPHYTAGVGAGRLEEKDHHRRFGR